MIALALILSILLPVLMAAAFLLGRRLQRREQTAESLSPVTRQHFELFQGGHLNQVAVEAAKHRFTDLLERGEVATVEASLRPGMHYVFQVRALAEIGTDVAGRILERQLQRRLSNDQLEQAWYWIDLAGSLRAINREESLPHLLRCADAAGQAPLGHFFAAETVSFLGFAGYLRQPDTPLGRSALRLLHRALEGLRYGLPPEVVVEARLGEVLENLWDNQPRVHPLVARVAHEALRFVRRATGVERERGEDQGDAEAFKWQLARLSALGPALSEYLAAARRELPRQLLAPKQRHLADHLSALCDLRADAGPEILQLLERPGLAQATVGQTLLSAHAEPAIEALTWSKQPRVGPWLREFAMGAIPMTLRSQCRRRSQPPRQSSVAPGIPYRAILRALRGHPSLETESFLLLAAQDWDPTVRCAALGSLGWWEPLRRTETLEVLGEGRRDANPQVRQAARAALGRLGERAALHWFRQGLIAEDASDIQDAVQVIAAEGLLLLWPDLDRLTESSDREVAHLAREALERMSEDLDAR